MTVNVQRDDGIVLRKDLKLTILEFTAYLREDKAKLCNLVIYIHYIC